jgi:hypothetical protein
MDMCILSDDYEGGASGNGYNRGTVVNAMVAGDGVVVPKIQQYVLDSYRDSTANMEPTWDAQLNAMRNYWYLWNPNAGTGAHVLSDDMVTTPWATNPVDQGPAGEDANGNNLEAAFANYVDGYYHTGSSADAAANLSGPWHDNVIASGWYNKSGGNWLGGGPNGGTDLNNNDPTAMAAARAGLARFFTWYRTHKPSQFLVGNFSVLGDESDDPGVPMYQRPASVNTSLFGLLDAAMVESAFGATASGIQDSTEHFQGFEVVRQMIQYVDSAVQHPEYNQYTHYGLDANGEDADFNHSVGEAQRYSFCASLIIGQGAVAPGNADGAVMGAPEPWYDYYAVNPTTGVALAYGASTSSQIAAGRRWLGTPIDAVQTAPSQGKAYARRFRMPNGRTALVLVNPSANGGNYGAAPQTINLTSAFGGSWTHVTASGGNPGSNSSIDSGATVTSVTVPVGDGIILIQ